MSVSQQNKKQGQWKRRWTGICSAVVLSSWQGVSRCCCCSENRGSRCFRTSPACCRLFKDTNISAVHVLCSERQLGLTDKPFPRIPANNVSLPGPALESRYVSILQSLSIGHASWFRCHSRGGGGAEGKGEDTRLFGTGGLCLMADQTRLEPHKGLVPLQGLLTVQAEPR